MKNKSLIRLIAYFIVMSLLVSTAPVSSFAAKSTDLEKDKQNLEKEKQELESQKKEAENQKKKDQADLNSANSKVNSISSDLSDVESEIAKVDEALVSTLASIDIMNEDIALTESQIEVTTEEYIAAKAVEDEQYATMKLRIKYMYEKGDYTYVQLLSESKSFSDMMNKAEYIEKLYDYDRKLLLEYEEARKNTFEVKERLEAQKDELDTALHQLNEEEEYLNQQMEEKQEQYEDIEGLLASAQAEASVYRAKVANQNNAIKNLEKQSKAKDKEIAKAEKDIEAAKKAEEEEARKAAEEAAKQAAIENGTYKEETTSSSSDNNSVAVTYTASSSKSSKTYAPASSFNSGDRGVDIINYALQYVGNRYVYGGTSLTEGADCSGFIWRIYKDFGINIPRPGTSMRSIGREVSYSEARPGDIICYAGHVALYMGGGQIVHASTARTGIKVSGATYKSIITIRRVV